MNIVVINDCRDENASGRQRARVNSLFQTNATFVGVKSDIEAAGNIIDIIDSIGNSEAVVLVNVAPRDGQAKKWENGTPFGYFKYKNILVVSSIGGYTLSLVKKFQLAKEINVFDTKTICKLFDKHGLVSPEEAKRIRNSQFRSFDFLPRVAFLLNNGVNLPSSPLPLADFPDIPNTIWWIDNFGNCKTTLFEENIKDGKLGSVAGELPFFKQLRDVPDGAAACTRGSSGLFDKRFLEIAVQGGSAAKKFGLITGQQI